MGFYLPEKKRLCSGPLWSNLLRQHINYTARLGCHLLQTGQILIERSRYKKHLRFVSFLCNVTHTEWEEVLWIIINSHSVLHAGMCGPHQWLQRRQSLVVGNMSSKNHNTALAKSGIVTERYLLYLIWGRWLISLHSKHCKWMFWSPTPWSKYLALWQPNTLC